MSDSQHDATALVDRTHRLAKLLVDNGTAPSFTKAREILEKFTLHIEVGPEIERSRTLQAAVLTAVNTGARAFLGGVTVQGQLDVPLLLPLDFSTLMAAVTCYGGQYGSPTDTTSFIGVGTVTTPTPEQPFAVQITFDGWRGGVVPTRKGERLPEVQECEPAGSLAGAIAVSEAFQHKLGDVRAGRRDAGISLWTPDTDWRKAEVGPALHYLPSRWWVVGLGHLGQALLWNLGILPYAHPEEVELVLQDTEALVEANISTSPLTFKEQVGEKKARMVAAWCEARSFQTRIVERKLTKSFCRQPDEPSLLFCGVDNAETRAVIEDIGFGRVIEAGLGSGFNHYLDFQMHAFPGAIRARDRWGGSVAKPVADVAKLPQGYQELKRDGVDLCGLLELAGRAVGSSFVGTAVTALAVAQSCRLTYGLPMYSAVNGSFSSLANITASISDFQNPQPNLGFAVAKSL